MAGDPDGVREFDCIDCGVHTISIGFVPANDEPICATCKWLREIEDPVEREKLKTFLKSTGARP